jgi:hypothetical protein
MPTHLFTVESATGAPAPAAIGAHYVSQRIHEKGTASRPGPDGIPLDQDHRGHLGHLVSGANKAAVDKLDDAPARNLYATEALTG